MSDISQLDWQTHMHAGRSYLKTARNGLQRPSVFNNELIYQLIAMAVEKLLVGVYQYHGHMAEDHTLGGLVDGLQDISPLDQCLAEQIKDLGRYDDMCPLMPVNKTVPGDHEIAAMLVLGRQVAEYAQLQLPRPPMEQAV